MFNTHSESIVNLSKLSVNFRKPIYDTYGFNKIPATITTLLGSSCLGEGLPTDTYEFIPSGYDAVLLLFVDSFGWHFFKKYVSELSSLQKFANEGIVSCISSLFPSTTAAHVTCLHSNLMPKDSGIYEWYHYDPIVDNIIAPLPFRYARDHKAETLTAAGFKAEDLFPFDSIYPQLAKEGIKSHMIYHEDIANSSYSQRLTRGSISKSYKNIKEGFEICRELLSSKDKNKKYLHFYISDIDAAGHEEGIESEKYKKAVHNVFTLLQTEFFDYAKSISPKTAICLIADHGMTPVHPKNTHYLNLEIPDIAHAIEKNAKGDLRAPAGSCRDFFMHINPEHLSDVKKLLSSHLTNVADVYITEELIDKGFFGSKKPSARFLERVGNLVILPYANEAVFWYEKGRFEQHFFGAHGGLTPMETDTIFGFLAL